MIQIYYTHLNVFSLNNFNELYGGVGKKSLYELELVINI